MLKLRVYQLVELWLKEFYNINKYLLWFVLLNIYIMREEINFHIDDEDIKTKVDEL